MTKIEKIKLVISRNGSAMCLTTCPFYINGFGCGAEKNSCETEWLLEQCKRYLKYIKLRLLNENIL